MCTACILAMCQNQSDDNNNKILEFKCGERAFCFTVGDNHSKKRNSLLLIEHDKGKLQLPLILSLLFSGDNKCPLNFMPEWSMSC